MKIIALFFFFAYQFSLAQEISVEFIHKIPLKAEKYIGTDDFGNDYFIDENIFYKHGKEKTFQFTDFQLGELTSVDIINPLKITLFFKDANTVVFLDRHLIEINRIRFNQLPNFRTVGFATTASNNSLWIFTTGSQKLEVYDYIQEKSTADTQPVDFQIINQKSNFNFCWLLTEKTIEQYNTYGSLIRSFPNPGFTELEGNSGRLVVKKENKLFFLRKNSTKFQALSIPNIDVKAFYLNGENLYLYDGKFVHRYKLD